jgi:catalase (peroxidase I)
MEGYANPTVLNGTAGNSLPLGSVVGGRRHTKSHRKVSAKTIRKTLHKLGLKPKGRVVLKAGGEETEGSTHGMGGRRRTARKGRKSGLRKLFGY